MMVLTANTTPSLFGLRNSNKDFSKKKNWGKNQFNSTFPASLACFMGSKGILPVYLKLTEDLKVEHSTIGLEELFGLDQASPNLYFGFENQFATYAPLVIGKFDGIDLVTMDLAKSPAFPLRGLEVKLTAIPDNVTRNKDLQLQGPEIVIRPQSIYYLAMRIASYYREDKDFIRETLNPICMHIRDWSDHDRVAPYLGRLIDAMNKILLNKLQEQSPFVMQPIWRSDGVSLRLAVDCFDMFVWSDMAFTRLFVDLAARASANRKLSRQSRTVFWLAKMLFDFSVFGQFNPRETKDTITFGAANDKAFAVSGQVTNGYLRSPELETPRIKSIDLRQIILGGGHLYLQPERRLDAAIVTTQGIFDE
ncbi:MAG TPA: HindVP family restriction endonuclease [Anaerolineales bacterium]|nr:HindVP family restriction endonuclease [Anaerolineales bacterium]HRQ91907.1 HindVP family restriction endonuclease [Anaerolineales bacterium]